MTREMFEDILEGLDKFSNEALRMPLTKVTNVSTQYSSPPPSNKFIHLPAIADVIYNDPAVVVKFKDGTKTVAKCDKHDRYNREFGFLVCLGKRAFGNAGFHKLMDKWVYDYKKGMN